MHSDCTHGWVESGICYASRISRLTTDKGWFTNDVSQEKGGGLKVVFLLFVISKGEVKKGEGSNFTKF